nr:MAG TPA: hypothetical protein [Caudoviricetes sp.]
MLLSRNRKPKEAWIWHMQTLRFTAPAISATS